MNLVTGKNVDKEVQNLVDRRRRQWGGREEQAVAKIVGEVARRGDSAVSRFTRRFDGVTLSPRDFWVTEEEFEEAYTQVTEDFIASINLAIRNVTAYHSRQRPEAWSETFPDEVSFALRSVPIERVGVYVPGGQAAYPTTVVMNCVPAKLAGVSEIIVATPPQMVKVGSKRVARVNPHVLVAVRELGLTRVLKAGGAQAVAALTFGTRTIPSVDKIVGPGNLYVTLAKKLVYGQVGIDTLAGPSEVVIVADESANPKFIAADLMAQAEHDALASAILVANSKRLATAVTAEIRKQVRELPAKSRKWVERSLRKNGLCFVVESFRRMAEIVNRIGPEHVEIHITDPKLILPDIRHAGAVFVGPYSPVAVGDYVAGPNHVLPTAGAARFASPLGVYDFFKRQSIVTYSRSALDKVRHDIDVLTAVEGLIAHNKSVDIRFRSA